MKVKHVFEGADFKGSGQMIVRNSSPPGSTDIGFMATVAYKVGFDAKTKKCCKVALSDGAVFWSDSKSSLAERLNSDDYGYRPMTPKEIQAVMEEIGNRFWASDTEEQERHDG